MPRFATIPSEIEAVQWHIDNVTEVRLFVGADNFRTAEATLWVEKSQAWCHLDEGDWIIAEPDGKGFYPCAAAIFRTKYREVEHAG